LETHLSFVSALNRILKPEAALNDRWLTKQWTRLNGRQHEHVSKLVEEIGQLLGMDATERQEIG
jgi:hypothetical protein